MRRRPISIATLAALATLGATSCQEPAAPLTPTPPENAPVESISEPLAVAPKPQALLVVGSTPLTGGDLALSTRLSATLGYGVTVVTDAAATAAQASGMALVMISESVTDTQVNTKFKTVQVPVMVLEPQLFDDMGLTPTGTTNFGTQAVQAVTITNSAHPMAGGLTGTRTISTSAQAAGWGIPVAAADRI